MRDFLHIACLLILAARATAAPPATSRAPNTFTLSRAEQITIDQRLNVTSLVANDQSTVTVAGGQVATLTLNQSASARIESGSVNALRLNDNSSATILAQPTVGGRSAGFLFRDAQIVAKGHSRLSIEGGTVTGTLKVTDDATLIIRRTAVDLKQLELSGAGNAVIHIYGDQLDFQDFSHGGAPRYWVVGSRPGGQLAMRVVLEENASLHLHTDDFDRIIDAGWFAAQTRRDQAERIMNVPPSGAGPIDPPSTMPATLLLVPFALLTGALVARLRPRDRWHRPARLAAALTCIAVALAIARWIGRPFPESLYTRRTPFSPPHWLAVAAPPAAALLGLVLLAFWRRKLALLLTSLSTLLLIAILILWVRSYRHHDQFTASSPRALGRELARNYLLRTTVIRSSAGGIGLFAWTSIQSEAAWAPLDYVRWVWEDMQVRPDYPWTASLFWGPGTRARRLGVGFEHHTYRVLATPPLTTYRTVIVLPYWALCLPWAIAPAASLFRLLRARRRLAHDRCPTCAYDLRATTDRCPECGTLIPKKNPAPTNPPPASSV
jgi:hypothetical protein